MIEIELNWCYISYLDYCDMFIGILIALLHACIWFSILVLFLMSHFVTCPCTVCI